MSSKRFAWLTMFVACAAAACQTEYTPPPGGAAGVASQFPLGSGGSFGGVGAPGAGGTGAPGQGGVTSTPGGGTAGTPLPSSGGAAIGGAASGGFPGSTGGTGEGMAGSGVAGVPVQPGGGTGAGGSPLPGAGGAPPAQTCPATSALQPGSTTNGTLQFGGASRTYIVHVPASYTGKTPVPLVTDYHGILLNNAIQQSISGWQAKSDQEGFIVAWPNGIDAAWNVGPCCTTSRTVDDVGFAKAVVQQIESQACIDTKRVYATGYSMGGGMSLDLACNAADVFAAIAPAAFDLMDASNNWPCHPSRPISIVDFRSMGDPIVPYAGGPTNPPNGLPVVITFLGAVKTFQTFAMLDQCTGSPAADPVGTGCQTYSQCAAGTQVTLCSKTGGGHDVADPVVAWNVLKKYTLP